MKYLADMTTIAVMFGIMLFCHYLADYPLQGEFIAKAKNRLHPVPHIPWYHVLFAHAYIHGAFVAFVCWLFTGYWEFGLLELAAHFITDNEKCKENITFAQDQWIHFACKLVWAVGAVTLSAV